MLRRRSCSLRIGALWLDVHLSSQIFVWTAVARRSTLHFVRRALMCRHVARKMHKVVD